MILKIWHVRLGVANNMHPLSWGGGGGGGTNGKDPKRATKLRRDKKNGTKPGKDPKEPEHLEN